MCSLLLIEKETKKRVVTGRRNTVTKMDELETYPFYVRVNFSQEQVNEWFNWLTLPQYCEIQEDIEDDDHCTGMLSSLLRPRDMRCVSNDDTSVQQRNSTALSDSYESIKVLIQVLIQ